MVWCNVQCVCECMCARTLTIIRPYNINAMPSCVYLWCIAAEIFWDMLQRQQCRAGAKNGRLVEWEKTVHNPTFSTVYVIRFFFIVSLSLSFFLLSITPFVTAYLLQWCTRVRFLLQPNFLFRSPRFFASLIRFFFSCVLEFRICCVHSFSAWISQTDALYILVVEPFAHLVTLILHCHFVSGPYE